MRLAPLIIIVLFFTSCVRYTLSGVGDGFIVDCTIKSIKVRDFGKDHKQSFVYADVTISNNGNKTHTFNLKDIQLSVHDKASSEAYIDGIASVVITDRLIHPMETFNRSVYWVLDGEIGINDLNQAKLLIRIPRLEQLKELSTPLKYIDK